MNRRQFLSSGGFATATAVAAGPSRAAHASGAAEPAQFTTVNLQADGLALDPREYISLLTGMARQRPPEADYYSSGGAVEELERLFAELLGKPAAIFLPTGTLANHLAVRTLAGADRRVLLQAESHLYNDSGDCGQTLSGLNLIPLAPGKATFDLAEVESWVERSAGGRVAVAVGVISIESPVRRQEHEMFEPAMMERVCNYARAHGIRLHLDGARLFSLPQHTERAVKDYTALFDTVYVSLWKHFNGASGAILAGETALIRSLVPVRRMFGGSLPQAWPEIALVADSARRFQEDYARAWRIAGELIRLCESDSRFKVHRLRNGTSRFFLCVPTATPQMLPSRLAARGIVLSAPLPDTNVFPLQVNPTWLRTTPAALFRNFTDALK